MNEDEGSSTELDKNALLDVPGGKGADIGPTEIEMYTTGQLFHLCEHWRESWTKAPSFSLGKLAQKLDSLAKQEIQLQKAVRAEERQEQTSIQMAA